MERPDDLFRRHRGAPVYSAVGSRKQVSLEHRYLLCGRRHGLQTCFQLGDGKRLSVRRLHANSGEWRNF